MSRLFTVLMRRSVFPGFTFPGGKVAERRVDACLDYLTAHYGVVGPERMVDYCVCQVYAISYKGTDYLLKWKLSHSFGARACARFVTRKPGQKYYEDRWLKGLGFDREQLQGIIEDLSVHETACRIDGSRLLYLRRFHFTVDSFFSGMPFVRFVGNLQNENPTFVPRTVPHPGGGIPSKGGRE